MLFNSCAEIRGCSVDLTDPVSQHSWKWLTSLSHIPRQPLTWAQDKNELQSWQQRHPMKMLPKLLPTSWHFGACYVSTNQLQNFASIFGMFTHLNPIPSPYKNFVSCLYFLLIFISIFFLYRRKGLSAVDFDYLRWACEIFLWSKIVPHLHNWPVTRHPQDGSEMRELLVLTTDD